MEPLARNDRIRRNGPLTLIIMDGMGIGRENEGNAFHLARTPVLDRLMRDCPYTTLRAHGTAVGLPSDDDMGNSEVGHNALGAGRIFDQGAKLVSRAIESGAIFATDIWKKLTAGPERTGAAIHFIGLLSDGNVHSHIDHLFRMIDACAAAGIKKLRVHILLDGRDVPETSALQYVDALEKHLAVRRDGGLDYRIASGGGRMVTTMDRYEADWNIVRRGWEAHVLGSARPFASAREAIETFRKENPSVTDQYLPSFTIVDGKEPVGRIMDGDSVVYFNFRGDRAIEISRAFDEDDFSKFDRGRRPDVVYAGMMEYDGDLKIPKNYLVMPPAIDRTMSEYLAHSGIKQYAISETQKFGHVTYFWNGNRSGKFDEKSETYEEIPSDRVEFNQRPWMKAAEIADAVIKAVESGKYDFIRLNLANGDMVGHTGDLNAAVIAAETVDLCVRRILEAVDRAGGIAVLTADHGNLDEMFEVNKKSGEIERDKKTGLPKNKTSHTLNPVPFIIYDPNFNKEYRLSEVVNDPGLANVAATLLLLMGFTPPGDYQPPVIELA
ncbi:MAG TPA: 2,3-bisphosphoglycerate-independent phosphoglycerate mutase [Spirochaetota bacterium]|nr:2,3-bisphosphoglycerate-independent phosphoglycerate mutase [Spirochaetota bacterium]HPC42009.1 2,3-bisphosphoglycerate-independent phosphoglycerate mutase [Spirochaetota bacterium]HQF09526.1 2,3-bisphosphoglycerate-independent phosphoglycerate mutase [Spirochaetota bacterium]HQH98404.1 2,3-bisphosphoglycerate-independent phosphoglycerate mutase [Spirochaetota bacterium]HQJ71591.1 2,3-bisphosphoglycerate-independent phosphoglycerate mutase [Spirochaetota bacterium]